jgi:predicted nucleic acid-binding protein
MMLLDTNVVSEIWRDSPNPSVMAWLDSQPEQHLFVCTPVVAELRYGVERLHDGKRKDRLRSAFETLFTNGYRGRILSFDVESAICFGRLRADRDRIGRPVEPIDAMIAAIALANRMALVTRNIQDFSDIGLDLIDPFSADISR